MPWGTYEGDSWRTTVTQGGLDAGGVRVYAAPGGSQPAQAPHDSWSCSCHVACVVCGWQVNVWVGPFFVLSGYVAAYTATELGKYAASPRVAPAWAYTVARVAGYYPLFILVQLLFAPMFIFADNAYNGALATAAHALMGATLTQVGGWVGGWTHCAVQ